MRVRFAVMAVLAAGALALAGCGGGGDDEDAGAANSATGGGAAATEAAAPAASGTLPDPCSLLSDAEAATALGAGAVEASTIPLSEDGAGCTWAPGGSPRVVALTIWDGEQYFVREGTPGEVPVSGLGDRASVSETTRRITWVQGGRTVSIQIASEGPARPALEELAQTVSGRL